MPNYSLWLEPTTSTYAPCAKFILDVAHRHAEAPYFPPHVTLVGGFHASDDGHATSIFSGAVASVSSSENRRGPTIAFDRVECGERRHQCVYLRLRKTDTRHPSSRAPRSHSHRRRRRPRFDADRRSRSIASSAASVVTSACTSGCGRRRRGGTISRARSRRRARRRRACARPRRTSTRSCRI